MAGGEVWRDMKRWEGSGICGEGGGESETVE